MLLVDDILLFPVTGFLWVLREIHQAVQQEAVSDVEAITAELADLYMMLETGKLTEAEFEAREQALLDRLDQLQGQPSEMAPEMAPEMADDDALKQ
jgi:predicted Zn-dependent peptidase